MSSHHHSSEQGAGAAEPAVSSQAPSAGSRCDREGHGQSMAARDGSSYQQITDQVLAALERGEIPWSKPWRSHQSIDGRVYRGINPMLLEMSGHESPFWLTHRQIEGFRESGHDLKIEAGAQPSQVVFWMHQSQRRIMEPQPRSAFQVLDSEVIDRAKEMVAFLESIDQPDQNGRAVGASGYRQTIAGDGWCARVRGPNGKQLGDVAIGRTDAPGHWHVTMGDRPAVAWFGHANPLPTGTSTIAWDASRDPVPGAGLDLFRLTADASESADRKARTVVAGTGDRSGPPILRVYRVFNADQIEGWDFDRLSPTMQGRLRPAPVSPDREQALLAAESIVGAMPNRPDLKIEGGTACYVPKTDTVYVPPKARFPEQTRYYEALFHELAHSTGHESRLNRNLSGAIAGKQHEQKQDYSREELVAEMSAVFLLAKAGLSSDQVTAQAASYIKGWSSFLKSDPKALVVAAAQAQKASDYILGVSAAADEQSPF